MPKTICMKSICFGALTLSFVSIAHAQTHSGKSQAEALAAQDCNAEMTPEIAAFLDQSKKMGSDFANGLSEDPDFGKAALKKQFDDLKLNESQQDAVLGMMAANNAASIQALMLNYQKRFWDNPDLYDKDDEYLVKNKIFKKSELDVIKSYVKSLSAQTGADFKDGEEMNLVKLAAWEGKDAAATMFKNGATLSANGWDLGTAGQAGILAKPEMQDALSKFVPGFDDYKDQIYDQNRKDPVFLGNTVFAPPMCRQGPMGAIAMSADRFAKSMERQLTLYNKGVAVRAVGIGSAGAYNFWKGHFRRGPETLTDAEVTMLEGEMDMKAPRRIVENCLGSLKPRITVPTYAMKKVTKTRIIKGGFRKTGPGEWSDVPDREVKEVVEEKVVVREDEMDLFTGTEKILNDRLADRIDGAIDSLGSAQWKIPLAIGLIAATGGAATVMMGAGVSGAVIGGGLLVGAGISTGEVAVSSGIKSATKGTGFWCEVGKNVRENGLTHLGMTGGFMVLGPAFGALGNAAKAGQAARLANSAAIAATGATATTRVARLTASGKAFLASGAVGKAEIANAAIKTGMYGMGIYSVGANSLAAYEYHGLVKESQAAGDDNMAALARQKMGDSAGNAGGALSTFLYPWAAQKMFMKPVPKGALPKAKPGAAPVEPLAKPVSKPASPEGGHSAPAAPQPNAPSSPAPGAAPAAPKASAASVPPGEVITVKLPGQAPQQLRQNDQVIVTDAVGNEHLGFLVKAQDGVVQIADVPAQANPQFSSIFGRNFNGAKAVRKLKPEESARWNAYEEANIARLEKNVRRQALDTNRKSMRAAESRGTADEQLLVKLRNSRELVDTVKMADDSSGYTQTVRLEYGHEYVFTSQRSGNAYQGRYIGVDQGTPVIEVGGKLTGIKLDTVASIKGTNGSPDPDIVKVLKTGTQPDAQ
jgi:hypothetical protein